MSMRPIRRKLEPGIVERVDADGQRLGLEIQYKDADGKSRRRSVQGGIHDARDALAAARARRARHGREPADPRMTLAALIDQYEAAVLPNLRPQSRSLRRSAFKRLRPALGRKRVSAINRADVRRWVAGLTADDLKANTVHAYYSALRALYTFAAGDLDIPVTFPRLKATDLPDPGDDRREHRVLTDDELARVLAACDQRWALCVRTLAETGCRASEGLGLTPRRIGDGTITFAAQLARDGTLRPLKTRQSRRSIELTRGLSAALRLAGDRERTFPLLTYHGLRDQWADVLKRAKLADPQPVPHDLRHTHASRLIALGWDPVEVGKRLGDRVETILRVYAHEFDARRRSAERRDALEALYGRDRDRDGDQMATYAPSHTITDGARVQHLRSHQNKA
jgi:integrase